MDAVLGDGRARHAVALERHFVPLTVGILSTVCFLAISVPSIWMVICYIGSVSATGEAHNEVNVQCSMGSASDATATSVGTAASYLPT